MMQKMKLVSVTKKLIQYCIEKRLSVDEVAKMTKIKKEFVEKISKMYENSKHKRLPPVGINER